MAVGVFGGNYGLQAIPTALFSIKGSAPRTCIAAGYSASFMSRGPEQLDDHGTNILISRVRESAGTRGLRCS